MKPAIVDLFSGCGGFGLGAELAGFKSLIAVDIDPVLQSAYKLNFLDTQCITADVALLDHQAWRKLLNGKTIDGVIGGPPCQGFSRIGQKRVDDPRNSLVGVFFRQVNIIKPKFFIMENVEGLLDGNNKLILQASMDLVRPHYEVIGPLTIRANEYGAPTTRTRIMVIGYLKSYVDDIFPQDLTDVTVQKVNVKDAIYDLPEPTTVDQKQFQWVDYRYNSLNNLSHYAKRMRSLPTTIGLGNKDALNRLKQGQVSGLQYTVHTDKVAERYKSLPNGMIDKVSKSKKLDWGGLCPTLRAGTGPDKGSYQAVRPLHPEEARVITVREAARLQGFPDWFLFHPTKWTSFRMIGNSVSPIVSEFILTKIIDKLSKTTIHSYNDERKVVGYY